jgi:hypothetical protein
MPRMLNFAARRTGIRNGRVRRFQFSREDNMRERAIKIMLVLVGLLFLAGVYPIAMFLLHPGQDEATIPMMLSIYVTLGIFVLLAARNPSANRSLIAFAGWSSLAHAAVMVVQSFQLASERSHLLGGVAMFGIIGAALIALAPAKPSTGQASAASA